MENLRQGLGQHIYQHWNSEYSYVAFLLWDMGEEADLSHLLFFMAEQFGSFVGMKGSVRFHRQVFYHVAEEETKWRITDPWKTGAFCCFSIQLSLDLHTVRAEPGKGE